MAISQSMQLGPSIVPDGELPTVDESLVQMAEPGTHVNGANGVNGAHLPASEYSIPMKETLAYIPDRKLRVVTIGAGFSGLLMAHKFQHAYPELHNILDHTIFEARSDIGGTWLVNTYPGVQCDVPSHIYVNPPALESLTFSDCLRLSHLTPIPIGLDSIPVAPRFSNTSNARPRSGIWTVMFS